MTASFFSVKTEVFEGPLDLLLSLIEKRKLLINDVSLSKVTDDFIAYANNIENFPIAESANFILIASTLVLIKSKSLLPTLTLTEEEEMSVNDLEKRLKIYKRIKDASLFIKEIFGKEIIFAKNPNKNINPVFSPEQTINIDNVLKSIQEVLKNLPKKESLPKVLVKKVISLEETIIKLTERIKTNIKMSFRDFYGKHSEKLGEMNQKEKKTNIIVTFLAMLELVKRGIIQANQQKHFEDIHMETDSINVPMYQ